MAKKTSLNAALLEASGKKPESASAVQISAATATTQTAATANHANIAPSRRGKKVIAGYFDPAVSRQLKQLAVENDTTVQALLAEALNLLFIERGKLPIAEENRE